MAIKWIIPKRREEEIVARKERDIEVSSFSDFNAPILPENDGGVCIADARVQSAEAIDRREADEDIRAGRVKTFDNPDDMIASLKQPW
jgi:hypothetical protein